MILQDDINKSRFNVYISVYNVKSVCTIVVML